MERNIEIIDKLHSYVWAKENEIVIKEYFVDNKFLRRILKNRYMW